MRGAFLPVLGALSVIVLWAMAASQLPPILLPSPAEVAQVAWAQRDDLLLATWQTGTCALAALAIAAVGGLAGGVIFLRSRWIEAAFYPYALLIQTLPIVAVAPLLVVWLGYGSPVAIASGAIASFFPILTAANVGLRAAEPEQVELLELYGASWTQTLFKLRFPAALPYLFAGFRVAGGLAVIGAIIGEFIGSNGVPPGLGFLVLRAARTAEMGLSVAAILCATALSLGIFGSVRAAERWVIGRWHAGGT